MLQSQHSLSPIYGPAKYMYLSSGSNLESSACNGSAYTHRLGVVMHNLEIAGRIE